MQQIKAEVLTGDFYHAVIFDGGLLVSECEIAAQLGYQVIAVNAAVGSVGTGVVEAGFFSDSGCQIHSAASRNGYLGFGVAHG